MIRLTEPAVCADNAEKLLRNAGKARTHDERMALLAEANAWANLAAAGWSAEVVRLQDPHRR